MFRLGNIKEFYKLQIIQWLRVVFNRLLDNVCGLIRSLNLNLPNLDQICNLNFADIVMAEVIWKLFLVQTPHFNFIASLFDFANRLIQLHSL